MTWPLESQRKAANVLHDDHPFPDDGELLRGGTGPAFPMRLGSSALYSSAASHCKNSNVFNLLPQVVILYRPRAREPTGIGRNTSALWSGIWGLPSSKIAASPDLRCPGCAPARKSGQIISRQWPWDRSLPRIRDAASNDGVPPGQTYTYTWTVPERAGPAPGDTSSILWVYHSHFVEPRDMNSGLLGPILIRAYFINRFGLMADTSG